MDKVDFLGGGNGGIRDSCDNYWQELEAFTYY